jgi:NADH dehydrogenase
MYAKYLAFSDVVVHLAAATGKATREEFFNVNCQGTKLLLEQCKRSGVTKFLYVSSIAVKFLDKSYYYYAQSKEEAEHLVENSGLDFTIIRPTVVLGHESPIWQKLSQIARAPAIPLFGRGTAKIQPIYVEDLVRLIVSLVGKRAFANETLEVGGPEIITIEDFLQRIHMKYHEKKALVVHLPSKPLLSAFSFVERFVSSLLPFNTGQLASFVNDGTAEPNPVTQRAHPAMRNVESMLALLTTNP